MRTFLSFHVPEKVSEQIFSNLKNVEGFFPYPTDSLHVTLKFVGETSDFETQNLIKEIEKISSKHKAPIRFVFKDFFIEDDRLRASIVPTTSLLQIQGEVLLTLSSLSEKIKSQVYIPHITLGIIDKSQHENLPKINFSFESDEFHLFESIQHEGNEPKYEIKHTFNLSGSYAPRNYKTIALPTRPQPDTVVAIFLLKHFGVKHFPGILDTNYVSYSHLPENESEESLAAKGTLLIDLGGGVFDHHKKQKQTTSSNLVSEYLGQKNNPSLQKLLQFAERDDFLGKGIISNDPLDRAFGLSGLIASLNKKYPNNPEKVIEPIFPLLDAHITEEEKRFFEMPKELEEKIGTGKANVFHVKQRRKKLKCILIETDNVSMAGFLRSKGGGGFDVVAIKLPTGHINILTRPLQRIDLRALSVLVRVQESESQNRPLDGNPRSLAIPGSLKEVPEWYYDTATNSLLNGGPNPQNIKPTSIDPFEIPKIMELGLSEQLWSPLN